MDGEIRHQVEHILTSRMKYSQLQYRVHWEGADEDLEWYNAGKLKRWPHKLKAFHDANPTAAGPPHNLDQWLLHVMNNEGPPPDAFGDNASAKIPKEHKRPKTKGEILREIREEQAAMRALPVQKGAVMSRAEAVT